MYKCFKMLNGKNPNIYPFIFSTRMLLAKYLTTYCKKERQTSINANRTQSLIKKRTPDSL